MAICDSNRSGQSRFAKSASRLSAIAVTLPRPSPSMVTRQWPAKSLWWNTTKSAFRFLTRRF